MHAHMEHEPGESKIGHILKKNEYELRLLTELSYPVCVHYHSLQKIPCFAQED